MLCSSRMLGSRQSLWPPKLIALSVATCPVNALAQVYRLSLSWTVPSSESFSHTSPVFTSATVPSPWSAYASGAPPRSSPSSPVPAHEMAFPLLSQHVVCPVAGSGQPHPLRDPSSPSGRTRLSRNGTRGGFLAECRSFTVIRSSLQRRESGEPEVGHVWIFGVRAHTRPRPDGPAASLAIAAPEPIAGAPCGRRLSAA